MANTEDVHAAASRLEYDKRELREDLNQISRKALDTKAKLSPKNLVRERIFLISALAFVAGFARGYWGVPVSTIAKPAAQAALTSAAIMVGAEAGKRAISTI